ncbi:N-formylglutamate amidohydrolase [Chelativorans sp. ZYF759]|uniref:N-formylglutamate amidohydrolase n=1 Tax=Chelativorans sp. ZYF759 TaxID=2692213 RepID=UPI00145C4E53|nr:N-formylglutamate amidohydrolase [Chelativorans sp. ZYF759]NMG40132.1 N-formylglutamate amidohydrolase [Chelativorans sp. ZYF759]
MTRTALFSPFHMIDGDRTRGMILIADHARRDLPDEYASLGLPAAEFDRHIAYDIGVEPVTTGLAQMLGVPAIMATYSRLLIDPNRGEDDPTLIRQLYDGTIVPGNYPMPPAEREKRLAAFHRPYHDAVSSLVKSVATASGKSPFIVSVHSFTPSMQGIARPWHAGILWDSDARAAHLLIERLSAEVGLVVGDNEPYDGALRGDTMFRHAIANGYAHALIEIRQDLIAEERGVAEWVERLGPILEEIDAMPEIHEVRRFGSRTGSLD